MRRGVLMAVSAAAFFAGCANHPMDPTVSMQPPAYVEQMSSKESEPVYGNLGSLYGQGESPLFSDRKAMRVNDIVRVIIKESASTTSSGEKSLKKSDKESLETGLLASARVSGGTAAATATPLFGMNNIGFNSSSSSEFSGKGSAKHSEQFTTTISARIIKVMSNNSYFIEGSRELLIEGQKQIIQISGVIRADDIDQYNKIDSTYIADARILYKTEGDLHRTTEQGWLSKVVAATWPF